MRAEYRLDATDNVSAHPYPREAMALFEEVAAAGGTTLDVGCGDQRWIHPSVICAEVVPYAASDVLAAGQRLPFRDAAFDAAHRIGRDIARHRAIARDGDVALNFQIGVAFR